VRLQVRSVHVERRCDRDCVALGAIVHHAVPQISVSSSSN
jgi:hypothetical protein